MHQERFSVRELFRAEAAKVLELHNVNLDQVRASQVRAEHGAILGEEVPVGIAETAAVLAETAA